MIVLTLILVNCWMCDFDMGIKVFGTTLIDCETVRSRPILGYYPAELRCALGLNFGSLTLFGYEVTCNDYRDMLDYIHLRKIDISF